MSKRAKRKIILIDGIRYYADRPDTAKGQPCVSAVCYQELDVWLRATRINRAQREGAANG